MQPRVERVEYFGGALERDAEVFVALVAGHLRFMHLESLGQLALRYSLGDAKRDQRLPQSAQILKIVEFTALEPFVALDFFFQLQMERFHWIDHPLNLILAETGLL